MLVFKTQSEKIYWILVLAHRYIKLNTASKKELKLGEKKKKNPKIKIVIQLNI